MTGTGAQRLHGKGISGISRRQFLSLAAASSLCSCHRHATRAGAQLSGRTMGGMWSLKLPADSAAIAPNRLQREIQLRLDGLEDVFSLWRPDSAVCRFNRAQTTDWQEVAPELAEVVDLSLAISERTEGAFDITVAPLTHLWGFGPRDPNSIPVPPDDADVRDALALVGYRRLHARRDPPGIRKEVPGVQIDLGAIGKGYAADTVASHLKQLQITDYLFDIGGQLAARGGSEGRAFWNVGIEHPTPDARRIMLSVELRDQSLASSGDYRHFYEAGGHRYCHELDPTTGRPVTDSPAMVSVMHEGGAAADALATALLVLGTTRGLRLADEQRISAVVVERTPDGTRIRKSRTFPEKSSRSGPTNGQ